MKNITQSDKTIKNPKRKIIYQIETSNANSQIEVNFKGKFVERIDSFDLSRGCFSYNFLSHQENWISDFICPYESLPLSFSSSQDGVYLYNPEKEKLYKLSYLTFYSNDNSIDYEGKKIGSLKSSNEDLQNQLTSQVKLPVRTSAFPIFKEDNAPKFTFLAELYQKFISYNDQEKLSQQFKYSETKCHLRAHFTTLLLELYGIQTIKLTKFWNKDDWAGEKKWTYHCAAMIVDDNNNSWVWEPWPAEIANKKLITVTEWTHAKYSPEPKELLMANRNIISDLSKGRKLHGDIFKTGDTATINLLQRLFSDAVPNPCERPLFKKKLTFFKEFSHEREKSEQSKIDKIKISR